jgi:hypothetical protein
MTLILALGIVYGLFEAYDKIKLTRSGNLKPSNQYPNLVSHTFLYNIDNE